MQSYVNDLELRVVGMSRSGNHAIIDWLLDQVGERYCYLNCAEPKSNPFVTARALDWDGRRYRTDIPGFTIEKEAAGEFSRKRVLLYSYEDAFLGAVSHPEYERQRESLVGASQRRLDVIILRDPFNLLASRIRSGLYDNRYIWGEKVVTHNMAMRIWKQHAREVISPRTLAGPTVPILYNRWTTSARYRRRVLRSMGLKLRHDRIQRVAQVAGGSSFDGLHHDGAASQMKVFQRWEKLIHDPQFRECIDRETIWLSTKIFGHCAASAALLKSTATEPEPVTARSDDAAVRRRRQRAPT